MKDRGGRAGKENHLGGVERIPFQTEMLCFNYVSMLRLENFYAFCRKAFISWIYRSGPRSSFISLSLMSPSCMVIPNCS